jgi:hypothetical protein
VAADPLLFGVAEQALDAGVPAEDAPAQSFV